MLAWRLRLLTSKLANGCCLSTIKLFHPTSSHLQEEGAGAGADEPLECEEDIFNAAAAAAAAAAGAATATVGAKRRRTAGGGSADLGPAGLLALDRTALLLQAAGAAADADPELRAAGLGSVGGAAGAAAGTGVMGRGDLDGGDSDDDGGVGGEDGEDDGGDPWLGPPVARSSKARRALAGRGASGISTGGAGGAAAAHLLLGGALGALVGVGRDGRVLPDGAYTAAAALRRGGGGGDDDMAMGDGDEEGDYMMGGGGSGGMSGGRGRSPAVGGGRGWPSGKVSRDDLKQVREAGRAEWRRMLRRVSGEEERRIRTRRRRSAACLQRWRDSNRTLPYTLPLLAPASNSALPPSLASPLPVACVRSRPQYYHLQAREAAKLLGMALSCFKKVCRRLGVPRWPARKLVCLHRMATTLRSMTNMSPQEKQVRLGAGAREGRGPLVIALGRFGSGGLAAAFQVSTVWGVCTGTRHAVWGACLARGRANGMQRAGSLSMRHPPHAFDIRKRRLSLRCPAAAHTGGHAACQTEHRRHSGGPRVRRVRGHPQAAARPVQDAHQPAPGPGECLDPWACRHAVTAAGAFRGNNSMLRVACGLAGPCRLTASLSLTRRGFFWPGLSFICRASPGAAAAPRGGAIAAAWAAA